MPLSRGIFLEWIRRLAVWLLKSGVFAT